MMNNEKETVKEFNVTEGCGFIKGKDNEDYFVHVSGLRAGQRVSFDVNFEMMGDKVVNVRFD